MKPAVREWLGRLQLLLAGPETPAERHARMCAECQKVIRDPAPISEQERRRHRWLVAREMRRAEAKRKQQ